MNGNLKKYIGDYYHINNSWVVPLKLGDDPKKRTTPTHIHFDETNNLFVDVEMVQRSMVKFYEFTTEGMAHYYYLYLRFLKDKHIYLLLEFVSQSQ